MNRHKTTGATALAALLLLGSAAASEAQRLSDPGKGSLSLPTPPASTEAKDASHSQYGAAFDQGPRQQARLVHGIGNVHFPITTRSEEAQRFFDQGVNYLYSFFWFEAERSFRQAAKIDPECAMAYWGMAMADSGRGKEFIKLAVEKKAKATDHERRYIDALAINFREVPNDQNKTADNLRALEQLVLAYPDDMEAKAILAWAMRGQDLTGGVSNRVAIDALLKTVLAKNPLHPGAHHYRIHLWDGGPNAAMALDSCKGYARAVPGIGHAQHMPGHIYAQLGMWDQATTAMDSAARLERRYFYEQGRMPWESWNYGHDQDYLIANLGYTGRIREGIALAQELIQLPHDPQFNSSFDWGLGGEGRFSLLRMRVRGERWDDLLKDPNAGGGDAGDSKSWRCYALGLASLGKGNREEARKQLKALEELKVGGDTMECARLELRGRLMIVEGDTEKGLAELKKAFDTEKSRWRYNDPAPYPRPLYESLAWGQITAKRFAEAETTLRDGLQREPNNGFALCLLVEALTGEGKRYEAEVAYEQLQRAWPHADADLPMLQKVERIRPGTQTAALTVGVTPTFSTPFPRLPELDRLGPSRWKPFPTPDTALRTADGKTLRLSEFRGHNVLLVIYLGGICLECTKQLEVIGKEKAAFDALDTRMVALSGDSPEKIKTFLGRVPDTAFQLLSDPNHEASRRFNAYDEFENLPLHATILINKEGKVWWFRSGSEPFSNTTFLKNEIPRMDAWLNNHPR